MLNRRMLLVSCWVAALLAAGAVSLSLGAEMPSQVELPAPRTDGGLPLMQALKERQTTREFKSDPLPTQVLSDLLWAAFGINRPQAHGRTAPSAMNSQEVEIYLAQADGLYLYLPGENRLKRIKEEDIRSSTSGSPFATQAPVTLIFVADLNRMEKAKPEDKPFYSAIDTGCISQNVYLFCASAGLGTVVHDLDRAKLSAAMSLMPNQRIVLAQAVGYKR